MAETQTTPEESPAEGITITANAAKEIKRQADKRGTPNACIRVGIRGGGCTGFSYVFEWEDVPKPTDKVFSAGEIRLVVDPKSYLYLRGTELDFVREGLNEGFKFHNPREKDRCGCGESFRV